MPNPRPEQIESEAFLAQLLVESVRDYAILTLDPEGRISSWNRGARQIKGYDEAEVLGRHYSIFFPAEDREEGKPERLLRVAEAEGRVEDEGWRLRKDGSRLWANAVITALRGDEGELLGFARITRDLTEQRAAAEALRARERQLTDTQRLAGLGSWEWDVPSDRVTWTEELYRIYGLDPETFGATFQAYLDRVHPDDRDRVRREVEGAYRDGGEFEFEERIVQTSGEVRHLRSRGRAVQDGSGRVVRLMGACLDVTALKEAEQRTLELAREQAARAAAEAAASGLRFLLASSETLASSPDCAVTLRTLAELAVPGFADWCAVDLLEGGDTLRRMAVAHQDPTRVELARRYAERYPPQRDGAGGSWRVIDTGEPEFYPEIPDELLRSAIRDEEQLALLRRLGLRSAITVPLTGRTGVLGALTLVHAESGRRFTERDLWVAQQLGRHSALAIETARLLRTLEDRNRDLATQAAELEEQKEELQSQAVHLEEFMVELEATNDQLQQRTTEAEQANQAKSEFLATMSHELRTPLNAIFGYADLLDLGLHGPVTPAQHEALERIKRNQRALLALVNDVLNFARLEAGKLEISLSDVLVHEVVSDLEKMVGPQLRARRLRYECRSGAEGLRARGERERIEQILLNLLTNAIKFTEPGGGITLSVEADDREVRLSVQDTGRGIPPDKLASVFEPFVQIDRQPEDSGDRGVGLGLAISQDLAEAMGGSLSARSAVGEGSTFTLALPRAG